MAHEIEADNFVHAGEAAWHGIGHYLGVTDNASIEAALQIKPILGSTISHVPAMALVKGVPQPIPDTYAVVRDFDGKVLASVGDQQRQSGASPKRLLELLQAIVGPGKGCLHTAMYLREGRLFVATVKLGAPIEVTAPNGTKDETIFYMVAAMAFDGSMRTSLYDTIVRTVCANTLRAGFNGAKGYGMTQVKNTKSHEIKLQDAEREWANAVKRYSLFREQVIRLSQVKIADAHALAIFKGAFGLSETETEAPTRTVNNVETVLGLYAAGMGNRPFQGTAWGVLNALTEYADHNMVVRGVRDSQGQISDFSEDARAKMVDSALFGNAADFKSRAFALVSQAAGL